MNFKHFHYLKSFISYAKGVSLNKKMKAIKTNHLLLQESAGKGLFLSYEIEGFVRIKKKKKKEKCQF